MIIFRYLIILRHLRTLHDLKAATRNFRSDNMIGGGGFGQVYKGWIDKLIENGLQVTLFSWSMLHKTYTIAYSPCLEEWT